MTRTLQFVTPIVRMRKATQSASSTDLGLRSCRRGSANGSWPPQQRRPISILRASSMTQDEGVLGGDKLTGRLAPSHRLARSSTRSGSSIGPALGTAGFGNGTTSATIRLCASTPAIHYRIASPGAVKASHGSRSRISLWLSVAGRRCRVQQLLPVENHAHGPLADVVLRRVDEKALAVACIGVLFDQWRWHQ
jgi:hypothetical protein